jgi:hypothetical protein
VKSRRDEIDRRVGAFGRQIRLFDAPGAPSFSLTSPLREAFPQIGKTEVKIHLFGCLNFREKSPSRTHEGPDAHHASDRSLKSPVWRLFGP